MSTAAKVASSNLSTADDLETNYAAFCKAGRPMTTAAIFMVGVALIVIVNAALWRHPGNPFDQPLVNWIAHHTVEVCFTTPALIAALRGRKYVKSILRGRLTSAATIVLGIAAGCGVVLFSSVIGSWYFFWPELHPQGFFQSLNAPMITAYLLGPIGEEMLYQVGLQTWLQRFGPVVAVLGATAPFWAFHLVGGFVPMHDALFFVLPATLTFGLMRQTTKSLGAAVIAHSTYNALVSSLFFIPR